MKSVLSELFRGKIYPDEQIVPNDPEYRNVNNKISDEMDCFEERLSREDFDKLEELYGLYSESSFIMEEHSFAYGFKLGTLLMTEVFMGKNE